MARREFEVNGNKYVASGSKSTCASFTRNGEKSALGFDDVDDVERHIRDVEKNPFDLSPSDIDRQLGMPKN